MGMDAEKDHVCILDNNKIRLLNRLGLEGSNPVVARRDSSVRTAKGMGEKNHAYTIDVKRINLNNKSSLERFNASGISGAEFIDEPFLQGKEYDFTLTIPIPSTLERSNRPLNSYNYTKHMKTAYLLMTRKQTL